MSQIHTYLIILTSFFLFSSSSISKEYNQFSLYLTDEEKFDLWGSYNRGDDAVTDESSDELIYNHTCLFLSINEDNLEMKKGAYSRYLKVNKKKLQERLDYLESKSFDITGCSLD
ncbi:MAG: hypothetical protein CBD97_02980 [Pelagibacteraceae bacterium TMED237]|nr:MAG: hypothetical protein CBD97_02980 [Pelagibacteraceae bacterium TMED237]|tara:strand:+ start:77 stop:421 length:345 start_codon:yes stop_codon:yes gene_type:complete